MFESLIAQFATYQATKNIKRYITGVQLSFAPKVKVPVINYESTTPSPLTSKLFVYHSFKELIAGRNVDGSTDFIDVRKNPVLNNVILQNGTIKTLMEYNDLPYRWLKINSFYCSVIYNGKRKYFNYDPRQMLISVNYTADSGVYLKMKDAAAYEATCNVFVEKAQRNAEALAKLDKNIRNFNAEQVNLLNIAITNHLYEVNTFISSLPKGFTAQIVKLKEKSFNRIGFFGVDDAFIIIVAIVVAGITVLGVDYQKGQRDKEKQIANLNQQLAAMDKIRQAGIDLKEGKIDEKNYNDQVNAGKEIYHTSGENLTKATEADAADKESGGMLGQVKQIVVIGGIIWLVKEIFKK